MRHRAVPPAVWHMVKQGSFFQRLKERWSSGTVRVTPANPAVARGESRVDPRTAAGLELPGKPRVAAGSPAPAPQPAAPKPVTPPPPPVQRVEPEPMPISDKAVLRELATEFAPAEVKSSRKLSDREEAMLALGSHFKDLTTLLQASQARTDSRLEQLVVAAQALTTLPGLSQLQLDRLQQLAGHMEKQNALGEQLASTMSQLPALLQNVEGALARAAATDERTSRTVQEFQATMDRIHASMAEMVSHSDTQAQAAKQLAERRDGDLQQLAQGIEQVQRDAVGQLQRTTDEGLQSLRRSNEDQSNRLHKVVQQQSGLNRLVLLGLGLLGLGVLGLLALQFLR